jgi:hypothetical protein
MSAIQEAAITPDLIVSARFRQAHTTLADTRYLPLVNHRFEVLELNLILTSTACLVKRTCDVETEDEGGKIASASS